MTSIETADGPLDARMLDWVAELYGPIDPKFRDRDFLVHLLVRGPAGPALHAFALADDTPVGHACVVPTPARHGARHLRAGKLEALVVAPSHRGGSVARTLLDRLYTRADDRGFELIHAYVSPAVGRVIRFSRLDGVGSPSLVSLLRGGGSAARRSVAALQRTARAPLSLVARGTPLVRRLALEDRDLLAVPNVGSDAWAVVADDALEWYAKSPYVRVLEQDGRRLLVQLPGSPQEPLRVAAWHGPHRGTLGAFAALAAAVRLARETDAVAVRVQQQPLDPTLRRAARVLGFVSRHDLTTLWVRAREPSLERAEAVVPTPMLYLGF